MSIDLFAEKTLTAAVRRIPEKPDSTFRFIGFGTEEIQLGLHQLQDEATRRAAHLGRLGIIKGERLGLMMSEAHEFIRTFVGCVLAGVVPVPLSPPMTARSDEQLTTNARRILANAQVRGLVTTASGRSNGERIVAGLGGEARLLTVETDFIGEAPPLDPPLITPEDLCFLQYTSGSTTDPRGVMVTHGNLMANLAAFMGPNGLAVGPGDVGVSWLPLYHDMGLIGMILGPLVYVGPLVLLSTSSFARDPRSWLRAIDKYRGTITYAPNFAFSQVLRRLRDQDLEGLDLRCLRVVGCGAEPINAETLRRFTGRLAPTGFPANALAPSYGLAEATLAVSLHRVGSPIRTETINLASLAAGRAVESGDGTSPSIEVVSCGLPVTGHEVAIIGEEGQPLAEREVGEVVVRGESVTRGYFDNPQMTASTWRDGWLLTGDLGYLAGGHLFICGRKKEVIVIRGANYYPQDIEALLRELPGIKRGNVIAFGAGSAGQERLVVAAEVDPRESESIEAIISSRILEAVGIEVGEVLLMPAGSLPRTTSGKLQRARVRQMHADGSLPCHSQP